MRSRFLFKVIGYLYIVRLVNVIVCFYFVFKLAGMGQLTLAGRIYAGLSVCFLAAGGCVFNDVDDVARDRVNSPGRMIPRGIISVNEATIFSRLLFAISLFCSALTLNPLRVVFGVLITISLMSYSFLAEKVLFYKNLYVAFLCASLVYYSSLELAGMTRYKVLLFSSVFMLVWQREILMDVYHREGDQAVGLRTIPLLIGTKGALTFGIAINLLLVVPVCVLWSIFDSSPLFFATILSTVSLNITVILVILKWPNRKLTRFQIEFGRVLMGAAIYALR
jgi:4-hydroxybenzoate polyprenyltransferase